jgi:hypothetical protein
LEQIVDTIMLEKEEDDDILVYCCVRVQRTFSVKRKDGYYSSMIGRYLMNSEMNLREFFKISRDIF